MIPQGILDFFRDLLWTFLFGTGILVRDIDTIEAGASLGSATAQAARLLALFIDSGVWGTILIAFSGFLAVWGVTALIAVIARRGTAS